MRICVILILMTALLNSAIYHWDLYLVLEKEKDLISAWKFMQDYRAAGGTEYQQTERTMRKHVETLSNLLIKID